MLIGITGLAGSGKDTVANYLTQFYGFKRIAFADKLKDFALFANQTLRSHVEILGWEQAKKLPEHRRFLQDLGHGARLYFGDEFWIGQAEIELNLLSPKDVVVSDVRYENEFNHIKLLGGIMIRVVRPDVKLVNNHITETGHLDLPVDIRLANDGPLYELHNKIDALMYSLDCHSDRC